MLSLLRTTTRHVRYFNSINHTYPVLFSNSFSSLNLKERNTELMVCDMAGTTVDEGGIVYSCLRFAMNDDGLKVHENEMEPWHGKTKGDVIKHFVQDRGTGDAEKIERTFEESLRVEYFSPNSPITLIDPTLPDYFTNARLRGIKIALNTGYPPQIQKGILEKLEMKDMCDTFISAYDVKYGRPYPYMIFHVMEQLNIKSIQNVVKVGDTIADIGEGLNAGCGLVVGVESGADTKAELVKAGAHQIVHNVTDISLDI